MDNDKIKTSPNNENINFKWNHFDKSPGDNNEYRGIELKNGIKAMLISNNTQAKSAAGICIKIGSMNDPDYLKGLAHLCEHVSFMGSKKYPEENAFKSFIHEHGGLSNAYTASDHSVFFFDVNSEQFSSALDIFSQCFISPLFTSNSIQKAIHIINSEYNKNFSIDGFKINQLDHHLSDPSHPFNNFSTGNTETLETYPKENDVNVRDELVKFHSEWYSSNIMNLVICGSDSLDELERLTVEKFFLIGNKNVQTPEWLNDPFAGSYGFQTNVVPIKDVRNIEMKFPIFGIKKHHNSIPTYYINNLIENEGPHSLVTLLKEKGWCEKLFSITERNTNDFDTIIININLTENGIDHTDEIIELLFQYIHLIREKGIQKWIFEELAYMSKIRFEYQGTETGTLYIREIIENLLDYPMEYSLGFSDLQNEWKPELIQDLLSMMTPNRVRIYIISQSFESICDQTEKWYGAKYHVEKIPMEKIERWSNSGLCESLNIRSPNSFLPDSFDLVSPDPNSAISQISTSFMRVWYKQYDEKFVPKSKYYIQFISPIAYSDPLNNGLNEIFSMLLFDSLNESAYAAKKAGIYFNITSRESGFLVEISGFDSKQHILVEKLMEKLITFRIDPKKFAVKKDIYAKELKNDETIQPYLQAYNYMQIVLSSVKWTIKESLFFVDYITIDKLQEYYENFLSKVFIECLFYGNVSQSKVSNLVRIIEDKLPKNMIPLISQLLVTPRNIKLDKGNSYRLTINNSIHKSSGCLIYLQCGLESITDIVLLAFLVQILHEPCFQTLRTKEQLGYAVLTKRHTNYGVQGYCINVQSDKHPEYVESRIEAFIENMDNHIFNLNKEKIENYRKAVHNTIKHHSHEPYWKEITLQEYNFEKFPMLFAALENITKEDLYKFYKKHIAVSSPNRQKLSVHFLSTANISNVHENSDETTKMSINSPKVNIIDNHVAFKSGRALYPVIGPKNDIPRKGTYCGI